jgi:hypothetical protein
VNRTHVLWRRIAVAVIVVSGASACSSGDEEIRLPETPVLSGRERVVLAVERYVRVYERPERDARIISHVRRGDVLPVETRTPDGSWIEVRQHDVQGWLERDFVRSFSSREQALNARQLLEP